MAAQDRHADPALSSDQQRRDGIGARLLEEGRSYELVEAALRLKRAARPGTDAGGGAPFRFVPEHELDFPTSEAVVEALSDGNGQVARLRTPFFGLTGTMGVLPAHYTEWVRERERMEDTGLSEFLGIFHHRLASLYLDVHLRDRFWLLFQWLIGSDGGGALSERHPFHEVLFALVGLSHEDMRGKAGVHPLAVLYYAGLLGQQPRSAAALAGMLGDYFGTGADIEPFAGGWVAIPMEERSRLGEGRLGEDVVVGDRFLDPAEAFHITMGPMSLASLTDLLPGSRGHDVFERFVRFAVGHDLDFTYDLVLVAEEVPPARLTEDAAAPQRLGWTFWLRSDDTPQDAVSGPLAPRDIEDLQATADREEIAAGSGNGAGRGGPGPGKTTAASTAAARS